MPEKREWFPESPFGLSVHWGTYAAYGRGEQVWFRDHLVQRAHGRRRGRIL